MRLRALLAGRWPRLRHGLIAGLALGAAGALLAALPVLDPWRQNFDLWALFRLRGPVPPPDGLLLLTIDRRSSETLSLPRDPAAYGRCADLRVGSVPPTHQKLPPPHQVQQWPRCLHQRVLEALTAAGARAIVFDVSFRPRRAKSADEQLANQAADEAFAAALAAAGNVILARRIDLVLELRAMRNPQSEQDSLAALSELSPALDHAALGSGAFPLVQGQFERIDSFLTFGTGAGSPTPNLPALAVQLVAADGYAEFVQLLAAAAPGDADDLPRDTAQLLAHPPLQANMLLVRHVMQSRPAVAGSIGAELAGRRGQAVAARVRGEASALARLYAGQALRYVNYYGYPGSFPSLSYAQVLAAAAGFERHRLDAARGRTVVVGFAELSEPQQDEHYPTVFTSSAGIRMSGAELLATAIGNLLTGRTVQTLPGGARAAIAGGFGLALMVVLLGLPMTRGAIVALALAALYGCIARELFLRDAVWLPMLIPLALQLPAAILYAGGNHLVDANRRRRELRELFGKFLPEEVIERLLLGRAQFDVIMEPVHGVCLATDADRFTSLSENMPPQQLARFLDRYFEAVFPSIIDRRGKIVDVIGDAVLASWTGEPEETAMHAKAIAAALELLASVERFNAASPSGRLPTRIGLASGPITTAPIGAFNHFEFRPVGETVVTAARLQELNKMLGTRLLATEQTLRGADGFLARDLGTFLLRGKSVPTHTFELICEREAATASQVQMCLDFALALDALRAGRRDDALRGFRELSERHPQDGPSAFYMRWLDAHPLDDGGVILQS
jgi:adenylate cyclase